jgi:SSS family solute:Na+ symporter/sodium/pantothenate symporter
MTFMPLITTLVVTWIGFAAIPRFEGLGVVEADRVLPLVLGSWAGSGSAQAIAAMLVFLGVLAAIMSTADSVLLSLGSIVAEDLVGRSREDPATTRLGKRIAAAVMIAVAVVALAARDVTLWGLIELKMELLIQCVPAFLIAIHWKGLRARPTALGLVVGSAIAFAGVFLEVQRVAGVHLGVIGLVVNTAIAVAGSALARRARAGLD